MSVKSFSIRRTGTETVRSGQAKSYVNNSANGYILTGGAISSSTSTFLDIPVPGQAQTVSSIAIGPIINSLTYLDQNNLPSSAVAVSSAGSNLRINGSGFSATDTVYINNQPVSKTFGNATTLYTTVSGTTGNYTISVFSTANIGSLSNANVRISGAPTWTTFGALSVYNNVLANIRLQSSSDSTITYSLKAGSGSLPTGLSLLSSGYIAGTPTGYSTATAFSFIVIATDTEGQAAQQSFNLTVFIGETYFYQTTLSLPTDVSNTFISDASSNNFQITRSGDTRPSRLSPYWPGGWSGYFDGSGDYITMTGRDLSSINWTIECWVYFVTLGTSPHVFCFGADTNNRYQVWKNNSTGKWNLSQGTASTFTNVDGFTSPVAGTWYHVAAVRNTGTTRLYVNGNLEANNSATLSSGTSWGIGFQHFGASASDYVYGYISNFRVVSGTALYTANFTPSTTALTTVANTSLLTLNERSLTDRSPNNITITRFGDQRLTTFSPFNNTTYTITANSYSIFMDGTGDYLTLSNASGNFGNNDFTVELWVWVTSATAGYQPVIANTGTGDGQGWMIIADTTNTWSAYMTTNGTSWTNAVVTQSVVIANMWTHIALVRVGGQITLYVNGTSAGSTFITSGIPNPSGFLYIGYYPYFNTGARSLNGSISNLRIINGTALYNSNVSFSLPTAPYTNITGTTLLTGIGATIVDSSSNNYAITINGDARPRLSNPFNEIQSNIANYSWSAANYGSSGYFDGTGDYLNVGNNASFAFGTGVYTIECWVYPQSTSTLIFVGIRATGGLQLYYDTTSGVGLSSVGSAGFLFAGTLAINQWYHIAAVRTSTASNSTFIYINGALRATGTDSTNWTIDGPLIIGANQSGTEAYTGYISDVRWTKGSALYIRAFVPPAAPLTTVANTSVLTLQNNLGTSTFHFIDESGHNSLITRNGDSTQGSFTPYVPASWSAYFDGTGDDIAISSTTPSLASSTQPFTVESFFYMTAAGGCLFSSSLATTIGICIGFSVNTTGFNDTNNNQTGGRYIVFGYYNGSAWNQVLSNTQLTLHTWNHIACVFTGTETKIYLNGTDVTVGTLATWNAYSQSTWYIGRRWDLPVGPQNYITGYVSNFRYVRGTALYTANFTPATSSLTSVSNTVILTCNSPLFIDRGPYRLSLTRDGDVRITPFGPHAPHTVTPQGYSVYFDGTGDYLTVPSNAAFAFETGDFTVEAWVYPTARNVTYGSQIAGPHVYGTSADWFFMINTTGNLFFQISGSSVGAQTSTTTVSLNAWSHVVVVRSSGNVTFYINGVSAGTGAYTTSITNASTAIGIGAATNGNSASTLTGYISNLRIVKGTALYTANFTPTTAALTSVANTSLLTCHTTTFVDGSTNNFTITVTGDAGPAELNPFGFTTNVGITYSPTVHGGSAYFDGTGDSIDIASSGAWSVGSSNFTIEFWVYATAAPSTSWNPFMTMGGSGGGLEIRLSQNINGTGWGWLYPPNSGTTDVYAGYGTLPLMSWHHIAMVRNGSSMLLFRNGQLIATGSGVTFNHTSTLLFRIGGSQAAYTDGNFAGYISNFRLIKGTALYTSAFVPPTSISSYALTPTANTAFQCSFVNSAIYDHAYRTALTSVGDARAVTNLRKYSSGSLYFDGTGDYFVVPDNPAWAFFTGDFTIEFWYYPVSLAAQHMLIQQGPDSGNRWIIYYSLTTGMSFDVTSASTNLILCRQGSTAGWSINTWYHVALTRSGNNFTIFRNGTSIATLTDADSIPDTAGVMYIGGGAIAGDTSLNGYLDDIRITNGYARYTANFTPPAVGNPLL